MSPINRMTVAEALAALDQYGIGLRRFGSLQYQLFYKEDNTITDPRLIDELEGCTDVAREMRMERNAQQSGDNTFINIARAM